ncbi:hypothetical protein Taro_035846 [Colocasia esculenta]|uniref:Uncharacterized protein n=1 Tax=Colocasia esculenta TaxID=4460 RepID=A0A843W503_COLES|nr:hypothetical protein [Colocasia esculenta]
MGLQCVRLQSRFDPFEVCRGVGTVVTAVVACVALWQTSTTSSCVVVVLCELVLPRGVPQVIIWFIIVYFECRVR